MKPNARASRSRAGVQGHIRLADGDDLRIGNLIPLFEQPPDMVMHKPGNAYLQRHGSSFDRALAHPNQHPQGSRSGRERARLVVIAKGPLTLDRFELGVDEHLDRRLTLVHQEVETVSRPLERELVGEERLHLEEPA